MSFGGFSDQGPSQPMAEINTTPLVDVMLVLLVIFIITAPLFQQAAPVDLPRADAAPLEEKPRTLAVTIEANGQILIDTQPVAAEALAARLAAEAAGAPELHLRAHRESHYDPVAQVLAAAQQAGITRIAFVTQPAER